MAVRPLQVRQRPWRWKLLRLCRWTPELRTLPAELRPQMQTPRKSPGHSASRRCPRHLPPTMLTKLKSNRSHCGFEDLNKVPALRFPAIDHLILPLCCHKECNSLTCRSKFFRNVTAMRRRQFSGAQSISPFSCGFDTGASQLKGDAYQVSARTAAKAPFVLLLLNAPRETVPNLDTSRIPRTRGEFNRRVRLAGNRAFQK
jgi:hypothetical protein